MTRMSAQAFDSFICTVADCLDPAAAGRVIAVDDHCPGVVMVPVVELGPAVQQEIDALLASRPRALALCVRTDCSAWLITAVCPEFPSRFLVKMDGERLLEMQRDDAPLSMLEGVARLRWALEGMSPWTPPLLQSL